MLTIQSLTAAALAATALSLGLPLTALAAPPAGRLLAAQCAQCHGTNGNAVARFESIAGEGAGELLGDLLEMKYRSRIESIMDRQARGYTDAQLRQIADYLAAQPSTGGDD